MFNGEIIAAITALLAANISLIFLYDRQVNPKMAKWINFKEDILRKEFEDMRKTESINIEKTIMVFSEKLNEIRKLKERFTEITSSVKLSVPLAIIALISAWFEQMDFAGVMCFASASFFALAFLYAVSDIKQIHQWEISTKTNV